MHGEAALRHHVRREGRTLHEVCTTVDATRRESSLTSGLRVYILEYYREAATPIGHSRAGHTRAGHTRAGHGGRHGQSPEYHLG